MAESPTPKRRIWPIVLLAFGVVAFLAAVEGPNILHDLREQERVETDPHVRGRVVGARATGENIHEDPLMELTVEFRTLDDRPIRAVTRERIDAFDAAHLLEKPEVDVWYDAANPLDIVIRWRERPE